MFDLNKHKVEITCPICRFLNPVTLKQVKICSIIICRGCKSNIQLQDHFNTVKKALKSMNRELEALEKTLGELGNITINI